MKPLWVISDSPRDKDFRDFSYEYNHRWFKLEETFLDFMGFPCEYHLWFELEKKPFVYYYTTSLGDPGIFW